MRPHRSGAFTLVEILIVVVILGILAAIVTPQLTHATEDAAYNTALTEVQKLRRHISMYKYRNSGHLPTVTEGDGTWGEIVSGSDYLYSAPINPWVGHANGKRILFGSGPDAAYQSSYGWIYNPTTGEVWAGGCDGDDKPFPRS